MKKIIKNYIVRIPSDITVIGGGKYETVTFSPTIDTQVLFEGIVPLTVSEYNKTELYINGIRYNYGQDYNIINLHTIKWIGDYSLQIDDVLVFVYR